MHIFYKQLFPLFKVGTQWDPKEETFRNYGRLLGPHSDITVALWCGSGSDVTYSVVYLDPSDVIAASYDVKVKQDDHVTTHSPTFHKPLRPGLPFSYLIESELLSYK